MRKDKGFEVLDNIQLYVAGNTLLEEVIKKNEAVIKHDTLAMQVMYNQDRDSYTETNINGEILNIDVEVIKQKKLPEEESFGDFSIVYILGKTSMV